MVDVGKPNPLPWVQVKVHLELLDGTVVDQTVEGDPQWVAGALRALVDRLDPPKRPTRGAVPGERGGPFAVPPVGAWGTELAREQEERGTWTPPGT